jgi:hypothetical protein
MIQIIYHRPDKLGIQGIPRLTIPAKGEKTILEGQPYAVRHVVTIRNGNTHAAIKCLVYLIPDK